MWSKGIIILNRSVENLTAVFLAAMVLLVFTQVVSREVFGTSFPWTEEVARYLMIWVTFLGATFAFQYGAHIGIEFFKLKLPTFLQKLFDLLTLLSCSLFFYYMIKYGLEIVSRSMVQTSAALSIPMGYVYLVIPISGLLMFFNLLDITIKNMKNQSEQPEQEM